MKQRLDRLPFLRAAIVPALIGMNMLSGCATATIEDAVPSAAASQPAQAPAPAAVETASSNGPKDTGSYPNLNIKPQSANQQFTPQQKTAETQALQAAHAQQAATPTNGTTDPAILRKLAATHAEDALKAIEGQQ